MEFSEVVRKRRSIRDFDERPIDKTILKAIVEEAQWAPSWVNSQPWKVYIATGETLKAIKKEHLAKVQAGENGYSDFKHAARESFGAYPLKNMQILNADLGAYLKNDFSEFSAAQGRLYRCGAAVYITIPKGAPEWAIMDMGGFEQTLMLSAANKGIDSIPAYEFVKYPDMVRRYLGIPENELVAIGVGLGYVSDNAMNGYRSPRAALDDMLVIKD
ncbi:MAG: nitroreductase [Oxalobacter sp.]|nr:nitroreductase [Oxalobacter sp.]